MPRSRRSRCFPTERAPRRNTAMEGFKQKLWCLFPKSPAPLPSVGRRQPRLSVPASPRSLTSSPTGLLHQSSSGPGNELGFYSEHELTHNPSQGEYNHMGTRRRCPMVVAGLEADTDKQGEFSVNTARFPWRSRSSHWDIRTCSSISSAGRHPTSPDLVVQFMHLWTEEKNGNEEEKNSNIIICKSNKHLGGVNDFLGLTSNQ